MTAPDAGRWNDLRTRVISAIAMVLVGGVDIWWGGLAFSTLVALTTGLMVWELTAMTTPRFSPMSVVAGVVAAVALAGAQWMPGPYGTVPLAAPVILLALGQSRDRIFAVCYGAAILIAGFGLIALRMDLGMPVILWLIGVVFASDILGYFTGRSLGGPKFWPAISPKKTWSGTVAGWVGAALVGWGFVLAGTAGYGLVILSPLVAFAGQIGDIAESWLKRRAGVKDSSHLIPGHGGVLDRFDAVIGAVVVVIVLRMLVPLPLPAGS